MKKYVLAISFSALFLASCAQVPEKMGENPDDPWEAFNRQTYAFNMKLDDYVAKPVAQVYADYVPRPVRTSIGNFFNNLTEPRNILNNALQAKPGPAAHSFWRFVVNTTLGIGGLFDVAKHLDLPPMPEDFGQTLAVWGVSDGPYVVWPIFGSSTVRDTAGLIADYAVKPQTYLFEDHWALPVGLWALDAVDTRASLIGPDEILRSAIDPYVAVKNAYQQSRQNAVYDGNPPLELMKDEFEDEEE